MVSPLEADCGRFFSYAPNGEVRPAPGMDSLDQDRARYTIAVLNLNAPYLRRERRLLITETIRLIDELLDDDLSALRHFAEADLCAVNGRLNLALRILLTEPTHKKKS